VGVEEDGSDTMELSILISRKRKIGSSVVRNQS
jgi:hypothetical protein